MRTKLTEVNYNDVMLDLKFTEFGKYTPATMDDPAEFPEFKIIEVLANDLNVLPILLDSQMDDLYNLLKENYGS